MAHAMRLAHAHDVILSDVRAAQKILALHVEDVDNVQELIRISLDEVREEIATNYTDLAIEVHAVQALYSEPAPPSSQSPSLWKRHVLTQVPDPGGPGGGGGEGGGGGG